MSLGVPICVSISVSKAENAAIVQTEAHTVQKKKISPEAHHNDKIVSATFYQRQCAVQFGVQILRLYAFHADRLE